jgi:hypothetical protein
MIYLLIILVIIIIIGSQIHGEKLIKESDLEHWELENRLRKEKGKSPLPYTKDWIKQSFK